MKMIGFFKLEPWKDKTALIMGVNSELGVAIAEKLIKMGMLVLGVDKKSNHLENLQKCEKFHFVEADLSNEDDILGCILKAEEIGGADLLINNIEIFAANTILEGCTKEWRELVNKYILSVNLNIREIIRSVTDRNAELGHIVNVLNFSADKASKRTHLQLYQTLKNMVESLTMYLRQELEADDSVVRISSVSSIFENPLQEEQRNTVKPCHFADAIEHIITAPFHVQIRNIVLEAMNN